MIERVHLKLSKVTGCYEVIKTERLSESEEAQRLYDAREKALWAEQSRLITAINKRDVDVTSNFIAMGLTNEQISEGMNLPLSEIEKLRAKLSIQATPTAK